MRQKPVLLLADVDERSHKLCQKIAGSTNCELLAACDESSVLRTLKRIDVDVVLLDLGTIPTSLDLLKEIKSRSARIEIILLDEKATTSAAVQAIKAGASDYLEKPLDAGTVEKSLIEALSRSRSFRPSIPTLEEMERQAIHSALAQAGGDKLEAARLLSIGKTTVYRKLREYRSPQRSPRTARQ